MAGHVHAELMMQCAKDAIEIEKPLELWEFCCDDHVPINGIKIQAPAKYKLERNTTYFLPNVVDPDCPYPRWWNGDEMDNIALERGFVHLSAGAAAEHAKALLSYPEKKGD